MTWQKRTLLAIGLATIVLGTASVAQAQYGAPPPYAPPPRYAGYPPPPPPPPPPMGIYRSGFNLGASLGLGGINAEACGDLCGFASALEFHLGFMLNPRLAIVGDVWFNNHGIPGSDSSTTHTLFVAALQYWATDKLWLKGGLGGATMRISDDYSGFTYNDASSWGITAAGGFEFLQVNNLAFDAQLRYGHGFYGNNLGGDVNVWAIMIGVSWY